MKQYCVTWEWWHQGEACAVFPVSRWEEARRDWGERYEDAVAQYEERRRRPIEHIRNVRLLERDVSEWREVK